MQQIQFPAADADMMDSFAAILPQRSPLFNADNNILYIKGLDNTLHSLSSKVDNDNIILNSDNQVALADSIHVKGLTVQPSDDSPIVYGNLAFEYTTAAKTIIAIHRIEDTPGSMSGELYEYGDGIQSSYHFSASNTGSRSLQGSSNLTKAYFEQCKGTDGYWYVCIKFPSGIPATLYFHGFDNRADGQLDKDDYDDTFWVKEIVLNDEAEYYSVTKEVTSDDIDIGDTTMDGYTWKFHASEIPSDYVNNEANIGVDFGNGLILGACSSTNYVTTNNYTYISNNTYDTGFIHFVNSGYFYIDVDGAYTFTVLGSKSGGGSRSIWAGHNSDKSSSENASVEVGVYGRTNGLVYLTYSDTDPTPHRVYIGTNGSDTNIHYISMATNQSAIADTAVQNALTEVITSLPETGEDGTPNRLVVTGLTLSLSDLQAIAALLQDSDYQVCVDLSGCTVDSTATTWSTEIFDGCIAIHEFIMPQGVTDITGAAWSNCTFMQVCTLCDGIQTIGGTSTTSYGASFGPWAACRLREVYIPKGFTQLTQFLFAHTNIRDVYFDEDETVYTQGTYNGTDYTYLKSTKPFAYGCLEYCRDDIKFHMGETLYNELYNLSTDSSGNYTWITDSSWLTAGSSTTVNFINNAVVYGTEDEED